MESKVSAREKLSSITMIRGITMSEINNIILYGAGTQNLRMAYQPIVAAGYNILAICDQDEKKQGTRFKGIPIVPLDSLKKIDQEFNHYTLVITIRNQKVVAEVIEELKVLKNAEIFTFEDFIPFAKLNSKIVRFSCLMFHLADDCNLDCVRCSHFSPLVERGKSYLDEVQFEEDIKKLAELTGGDVDEIQLAGGEPMLHPKAHLFPYIIRKYFKRTHIIMITNGTLIKKMEDIFWTSCLENKLQLMVTRYPIGVDYDALEIMLKNKGIDVEFGNSGNDKNNPKLMWGLPLVVAGGLDKQYNFDGCLCMQYVVRDGWIYPCANSAYIDIFNKHFDKSLPGPEANGVYFRNAVNLEEIMDKISKPTPLCAYCDARKRLEAIAWRRSKKTIDEWTL